VHVTNIGDGTKLDDLKKGFFSFGKVKFVEMKTDHNEKKKEGEPRDCYVLFQEANSARQAVQNSEKLQHLATTQKTSTSDNKVEPLKVVLVEEKTLEEKLWSKFDAFSGGNKGSKRRKN